MDGTPGATVRFGVGRTELGLSPCHARFCRVSEAENLHGAVPANFKSVP